ncbi:MAG: hypothetical protein IPK87_00790 [Planctomycetes bacterium]|nr:hypothetical protein [Planctomycetota bacterium]
MTTPITFSEAAQLYARNAAIVDAMYRAYRDEILGFWQSVFDHLKELEPGWKLHGDPGKGGWFQFLRPTSRKNSPYFALDSWESPEVITHGQIRLYAALENAKEEEKVALRGMASLPGCSEGKGGTHDLFRINLKIEPGTTAREIAEKIIEFSGKMQTAVESVAS